MQTTEKLDGSNEIIVVWISGHHGTPENEEADKLAKEGTNGVPSDRTVGITFVVGKEIVRSHLR
jgi:ribonuclease HI